MQAWDLKPQEIKERLDKMVLSFSRIQSADCMYAFYLRYIAEDRGIENGNSQFGKVVHETLEKFFNGELDIFTASQYYTELFQEKVTCDFPYNKYKDLKEAAYESGLEYFNTINFDFDKYEILGVEKECKFKVGKYNFQGYIDLLLKDNDTGDIIIVDHKTTQFSYLKNGELSKSKKTQQEFDHFKKQELLYAISVIQEFGKVDYLAWNMIRDKRIIKIPFDLKMFNETQEWAIDQIHSIEEEILWSPNTNSDYFCRNICSNRNSCMYWR